MGGYAKRQMSRVAHPLLPAASWRVLPVGHHPAGAQAASGPAVCLLEGVTRDGSEGLPGGLALVLGSVRSEPWWVRWAGGVSLPLPHGGCRGRGQGCTREVGAQGGRPRIGRNLVPRVGSPQDRGARAPRKWGKRFLLGSAEQKDTLKQEEAKTGENPFRGLSEGQFL